MMDRGPADGATNMATDVALMDHARRTGESTLRVYSWSAPTLSFGRHESTRGRFTPAALAAAGVDVVRRPTGGRALLHHREVTYSVTAPVAGVSLAESYRAINAVLIDALARLGVVATPAARLVPAERPGASPCFAVPNEGELVAGGAKLVGSAQWRERDALLQHGSILLDDDQARIAGLLEPAARAGTVPAAHAATLNALLRRRVTPDEVRDALFDALAGRCRRDGVTSPSLVESDSGTTDAIDTQRTWFRDAGWTWRR
jgi:lipoate-protein ligase A